MAAGYESLDSGSSRFSLTVPAVLLDLILVRARPGGMPQLYQDGIVHAHKKWLAARLAAEAVDPEAKDLPVHPLTPLVRAWQAQKYSAKPERRTQGILPSTFAHHLPNDVSKILPMLPPPSQLGRVDLGVTGEGHLPALDPAGGEETPALLLGLFDRHFGPLRKGPTKQPFAPVEVRVFLELLMSTPADARNGLRQSLGPFTIREIVGDWLGWDLRHYRPQGRYTGIMLAEGLSNLHNLVIPIGLTGGYFPVRLDRYSGLALDDKIYFDVRLPAGAGADDAGTAVADPAARPVLHRAGSDAETLRFGRSAGDCAEVGTKRPCFRPFWACESLPRFAINRCFSRVIYLFYAVAVQQSRPGGRKYPRAGSTFGV